jgi:hypothetical protein
MDSSDSTTAEQEFEGGAWLDDIPAWGISILVHGVMALLLMSVSWAIVSESRVELTSEVLTLEDPLPVEYAIDTEISQEIGTNSIIDLAGASLAVAQNQGLDTHHEEIPQLEDQVDPTIPMATTLAVPSEAELLEDVDLTGTTEHAGGTDGAIDRMTWEIAASLRERKTIVAWLFDESLSLKDRRSQIADRFAAIYSQLRQMNVKADENLLTGIVGFGQNVHLLQSPPINDTEALAAVVQNIQSDESGREAVFAAVDRALTAFVRPKKELQANLMLIIVTDERGDDFAQLESVIRKCTRTGARVYCIGNSAVFGREKGYVNFKWEAQGTQFQADLPVEQGPETAMVEGLQLPFWTGGGRNLDRMSAGFGPYALTRICAETGGIYFIADQVRGPQFDASVMRQYSPDYRPQREYEKELSTNSAKAALVKAAQNAVPEDAIAQPQQHFLATTDTMLRQSITEAQKPLATLDYYLQELHRILEQGERDRDKLDTNRWRASYDLAMGRVLAMRVRAFGYNSMLAEMKSTPRTFEQEGANQWVLSPADASDAGAQVQRMHDKAMEYLSRVVDEHPRTPWAWLAKVELEEPLGWRWSEATVAVPVQQPQNNNNRPQFAPEETERRERQRQRAQLKAATTPKL